MGFLMGAYGKNVSTYNYNIKQRDMTRIDVKVKKVSRQITQVTKQVNKSKQTALNNLLLQKNGAMQQMDSVIEQAMGSENFAKIKNGSINASSTGADANLYTQYTQLVNQYKVQVETMYNTAKDNIENYYEDLQNAMLEPLNQEETMLKADLDNLQREITLEENSRKAFEDMEKKGIELLKPNYNGLA